MKIKVPRYNTGICPICQSRITGRLKYDRKYHAAFHFGSPVLYAPCKRDYNCVCLNCWVMWKGYPTIVLADISEIKVLYDEFLDIDNNIMETVPNSKQEREILQMMAEDMYIATPKKKKKKSKVAGFAGNVIKTSVIAPFKAVGSVFSDLYGMAGGDEYKEKRQKHQPDEEEKK